MKPLFFIVISQVKQDGIRFPTVRNANQKDHNYATYNILFSVRNVNVILTFRYLISHNWNEKVPTFKFLSLFGRQSPRSSHMLTTKRRSVWDLCLPIIATIPFHTMELGHISRVISGWDSWYIQWGWLEYPFLRMWRCDVLSWHGSKFLWMEDNYILHGYYKIHYRRYAQVRKYSTGNHGSNGYNT